MNKKMLNYGKSVFIGIIIAFAVISLYILTDYIYFDNQILLSDYIDTIKLYVVSLSIVFYLILLYFFYRKLKTKNILNFVLLFSPYLLALLSTMLLAKNVPRTVDLLYLITGIVIVFQTFKEKSFFSKKKYFVLIFFVFVLSTYPYVYENINYNFRKNKTEIIQVANEFNFTLIDTNGIRYKLSDFKSNTVCVDMWSSTCGGCIRSMPDFEKLSSHFNNTSDYKIISLFCPMKEHETYEWFKNYIREDFKYNITYYYINKEDFKKLGIYQFPQFLLLNKNNCIVYRGLVTYNESTYDNIYEKLEKINSDE